MKLYPDILELGRRETARHNAALFAGCNSLHDALTAQVRCLPMYADLALEDVDDICDDIRGCVR